MFRTRYCLCILCAALALAAAALLLAPLPAPECQEPIFHDENASSW